MSPAAGAGLLAGAAAGAAESTWLVALGGDWRSEYGLLILGPLFYGALGFVAGFLVGVAGAAVALRRQVFDPLRIFGFTLGLVLATFLTSIFRFLYERDVRLEVPVGPGGRAVWWGVGIAVLLLCWLGLPRMLRGSLLRVTLGPCVLVWLSFVGIAAVVARLLPSAGQAEFHPQTAAQRRPNVLYLMVDTLRADHLSVYGAADARTPAAARLAADGVVFEQAISQAPWTRPSVATQLTSLPPHRHGARFKSASIAPDSVLLPEVFARAGYYCVGLYGNVHLAPQWGFARGYHHYRRLQHGWVPGELAGIRFFRQRWLSWRRSKLKPGDVSLTAKEVVDVAREEWRRAPRDAPIFLFVHLMDVHDPYFRRSTGDGAILRDDRAPASLRDTFREAYRDGVEYVDAQLAELLVWMKDTGRYDDTLIVLVSDHGEEFFEHGGYWHGLTLYEEQIHVPLILKLPRNRLAGSRQPALVRLLDLAPTIAAVADVASPQQWMGVPLIHEDVLIDPQLRFALSETDLEGRFLRALRGTRFKLIRGHGLNPRALPRSSLFDLEVDALEQISISDQRAEQRGVLEADLMRERDGDLWR